MTSRTLPLLAPGLEQDDGKLSASPYYPSHQRTNLETISLPKQEDTLQTEITEMTNTHASMPDAIPPGKGLLINRNFAWLASGQAISNLGDFVYTTTLFIWVFTLTHSAAAVSGVLAAQYLPVFLLGPLAGVFVDRWNRRQTMLISDLIRAGTATLPLFAPASLRLQAIYASVFLISAVGRFFMPAESGVLQVIVTPQQQMRAASIKQATFALSIIVGPALASPLYFAVGPVIAILLNAVSYLASVFCLLFLRAPKAALHPHAFRQDDKADSGTGGILRELFAGLKFVVVTRINHSSSGGWCFDHQFIHSRRVFPSIDLRDSSDADEPIGVALQHELLERAHLFQVALLCCPKDALSQITNSPVGFAPVSGVPVGLRLGSVCRE